MDEVNLKILLEQLGFNVILLFIKLLKTAIFVRILRNVLEAIKIERHLHFVWLRYCTFKDGSNLKALPTSEWLSVIIVII